MLTEFQQTANNLHITEPEKKQTGQLLSRLQFLQLSLATLGTAYTAAHTVFTLGREIFEDDPLSFDDVTTLLAKYLPLIGEREFGWYADFPQKAEEELRKEAEEFRANLPNSRYMGLFSNLEDIRKPEKIEKVRSQLAFSYSLGFEPVFGLGPGGWPYKPHPFVPDNEQIISSELDQWIQLFCEQPGVVHVRWLFESQIVDGDIAHKKPREMSHEFHQDRFKKLQELFAEKIKKTEPGKIKQHLAFAAAGYDIGNYLPQCEIAGIGADIYKDIHGVRAVNYLRSKMLDEKKYHFLPNTTLVDLKSASEAYGVPMNLYEFGDRDQSDWLIKLLFLFILYGGRAAIVYSRNEQKKEGIDWTLRPDTIVELAKIQSLPMNLYQE